MDKGRIFTDYYKAEQLLQGSKARFDVITICGAYPPFENLLRNKIKFNIGGLSFYYNDYNYSKANGKRLPQMAISRGKHISGVFIPDLKNNKIAFGDVQGTNDAIILIFNDEYTQIEIFVARGMVNDVQFLYAEILAGEFDSEIETLRAEAKIVFNPNK